MLQGGLKVGGSEPLWSDVEEAALSVHGIIENALDAEVVQTGVNSFSTDTLCLQLGYLIVHKRNKRCEHKGNAAEHNSGNLKGDTLSPTGWEQAERVVARQHGVDNIALFIAKTIVSPVGFECLFRS